MKDLKKEIEHVKSELEVIDAISIYDFSSGSFIYEEKSFKNFTDSFENADCFNSMDFLFWETDEAKLFIKRSSNHLVIAQLDPNTFTNNVLLDINIKKICSKL